MSLTDAYEAALDECISIVGPLNGQTSRQLPALTGSHWLTLFGLCIPSIVAAIQKVNTYGDQIPSSQYVDFGSGQFVSDALWSQAGVRDQAAKTDAKSYLTGAASVNYNWVRFPGITAETTPTPDLAGYTPGVEEDADYADLVSALRDLVDEYQRELVTLASFVVSYRDQPVPSDQADDFHNAMTTLTSKCDAIVGTEIPSLGARVNGGLHAALDASEAAASKVGDLAGRAAAEAGKVAGNIAGSFAEGFFKNATWITLAVAAVAVYYVVEVA